MLERRAFLVPSGYNFRAVVAFCRALRKSGHRPALIACTDTDPVFRTDFADDVVFTRPTRALNIREFARAVAAVQRRGDAERCVLAPTSEFLVRWAYQNRDELARAGCDLPLPNESVYLTVTEKSAFTKFARDRGLPVPKEYRRGKPFPLPAVAKPRWNVSPDGRSLYPWLLRTADDLERFKREERADHFFMQEWVDGRSYYLLFHLPTDGVPTIYSQENLAQQPGGKSIVLARAALLHETAQAEIWADALRAAGFCGLAMIEVRQRGSEYVLIEANPRLWGPLQLCVDGCPSLLMNYIAEHTRVTPPAGACKRGAKRPYYLWYGGVAPDVALDWHGETPRRSALQFVRHLGSDVYFRRDTWRYFCAERHSSSSNRRELKSPIVVPAI